MQVEIFRAAHWRSCAVDGVFCRQAITAELLQRFVVGQFPTPQLQQRCGQVSPFAGQSPLLDCHLSLSAWQSIPSYIVRRDHICRLAPFCITKNCALGLACLTVFTMVDGLNLETHLAVQTLTATGNGWPLCLATWGLSILFWFMVTPNFKWLHWNGCTGLKWVCLTRTFGVTIQPRRGQRAQKTIQLGGHPNMHCDTQMTGG